MQTTDQMLESKFNLIGLILAIMGGAIAALAMGYGYHLVANKLEFDYIIALAIIVGVVVGFVVGVAAKLGGLRSAVIVFFIAFVFGAGGYAARYYFEYNAAIDEVAQSNGVSPETLKERLPFTAYMEFLAESGISIGSRNSSSSSDNGITFQGTGAWVLYGIEALAAALVAGGTARTQVTKKKSTGLTPPAGGIMPQP